MEHIGELIDRDATMANCSERKGISPYRTDRQLANSLKSIIAGPIRYGDRLCAADLIEHDKCTCEECDGQRHTAYHVYWECKRHTQIRERYIKQFKEIFDSLKKAQGSAAVEELADCINNITFQTTGLCPDHAPSLAKANKIRHSENIKHSTPNIDLIVGADTDD